MIEGPILALDLAIETGWALGHTWVSSPRYGAVKLRASGEPSRVAMANLMAFIDNICRSQRPGLIICEAPMSVQAKVALAKKQNRPLTDADIKIAYGLFGVAEGVAERWRIRCETAHPATTRKFFIGHANMEGRNKTKNAVVARCHLLGLMPRHITNDNCADALSIWFWAASTFGHRQADKLFLFNEKAVRNERGNG